MRDDSKVRIARALSEAVTMIGRVDTEIVRGGTVSIEVGTVDGSIEGQNHKHALCDGKRRYVVDVTVYDRGRDETLAPPAGWRPLIGG